MRDSTDAKNASAGGEWGHAIGGTKLGRHSTWADRRSRL